MFNSMIKLSWKPAFSMQRNGRLFVLALVTLLAAACYPSGLRMQQSPLLSSLERKSGLIVYVGSDGNIYTMDQGGGRQKAVTSDARMDAGLEGDAVIYQFPTWAPDSRRLAFVGITSLSGTVDNVTLFTSRPDGSDRVEAFKSDRVYPFYLYWSPNSQHISFLSAAGADEGLSLQLVDAQGGDATILDVGESLYWSWSPSNRNILVHSGGAAEERPESSLFLVNLNGGVDKTSLDFRPTYFQSPAWSPNGEELLLAAEIEEEKHGLYLTDSRGNVKTVLAEIVGNIAFGWSPDGNQVAYLINNTEAEGGTARTLTVLNPGRPEEAKSIGDELIVAFFWSPDSKRIAYFVPSLVSSTEELDENGQPATTLIFSLKIFDVRSGKSIQVASFEPTQQFLSILPFFDQYQHSVTLWSPDSRNLVISAMDEGGNDGIFIVDAAANLQPRLVAQGEIAVWSWK